MDLTVFHLGLSTAVSAWPWKKQEEEREGCRKLLNSIRHLGGSFMVGVKSKGRDLHFRISLVRRPDFSWTLKTRAGIGCSNGTGSFWDLGLEYIPPLRGWQQWASASHQEKERMWRGESMAVLKMTVTSVCPVCREIISRLIAKLPLNSF